MSIESNEEKRKKKKKKNVDATHTREKEQREREHSSPLTVQPPPKILCESLLFPYLFVWYQPYWPITAEISPLFNFP